jgi:hypothetical protein
MGFQEAADLGQAGSRLLEVVQTELNKGVIPSHGLGSLDHLVGILAGNRQANLGKAQRQETGHDSVSQGQ